MRYYYTNASNTPEGPAELQQIAQMRQAGTLSDTTQVCAEGSQTWIPISSVLPEGPGVSGPTRRSAVSYLTTPVATGCEFLIDVTRRTLGANALRTTFEWLGTVGGVIYLAGAALALIASILQAVRYNNASVLGSGCGALVALVVLQFVTGRFLDASRKLIVKSRTAVNSTAMMDSLGLILLVFGCGIFIAGVVTTIRYNNLAVLGGAISSALGLIFSAAICLNPSVVSVEVRDCTAGEEAMGLLSFFIKVSLFVTPLLYFAIGLAGAVGVCAGFSESGAMAMNMGNQFIAGFAPNFVNAIFGGNAAVTALVFGSLVPVIAYFAFLFEYLLVDLIQAIVSLPEKVGSLRK